MQLDLNLQDVPQIVLLWGQFDDFLLLPRSKKTRPAFTTELPVVTALPHAQENLKQVIVSLTRVALPLALASFSMPFASVDRAS